MRSVIGVLAACSLFVATSAHAGSNDAPAWPGRLGKHVFTITRDGAPIGTQTITLNREGQALTVTTESAIAVKVLGLVVYRMHQVLTNKYRGERLVALSAETEDPGGMRAGEIRRVGNRWTGKNGKQRRDFECDCESSAMWHVSGIKGSKIIDVDTGEPRSVSILDKGIEILTLSAGKIQARHFVITGELERDVWYDTAGNLVAAEQRGSDGSLIRQTLIRQPVPSES
jgi:hypothetical protein